MQAGADSTPRSAFGRGLDAAARLFALLGGAVFTALTLLSLYSIVMRNLAGSPIMGDWELVQMGCAVAIAACFPMCQMRGAHIIVDFFTQRASRATSKRLDGVGALVLARDDGAARVAHGGRRDGRPRRTTKPACSWSCRPGSATR